MHIHPCEIRLYPRAAQLKRPPAQPTSFASRELQSPGTRSAASCADPVERLLMGAAIGKSYRSAALIPNISQPRPTRTRKQAQPYDASTSSTTGSTKPKSSKPGWDYVLVTEEPIR
ncbi:hypothetical protein FIBSPDRAFT_896453 [Athelia psychrophila]|uniref:Uncharacterized protein n=1 Tax=Athelia psychrophila TaxID=1759441 RepID=A0A166DCW6_9AGAM|nr:hypothetical protein FIBSPDRAFT_896453 [Fibularhizoctonia sp. CBS 109695]